MQENTEKLQDLLSKHLKARNWHKDETHLLEAYNRNSRHSSMTGYEALGIINGDISHINKNNISYIIKALDSAAEISPDEKKEIYGAFAGSPKVSKPVGKKKHGIDISTRGKEEFYKVWKEFKQLLSDNSITMREIGFTNGKQTVSYFVGTASDPFFKEEFKKAREQFGQLLDEKNIPDKGKQLNRYDEIFSALDNARASHRKEMGIESRFLYKV